MKVSGESKEIAKAIAQVAALARLQEMAMVTSYLDMAFDELVRVVMRRQAAEAGDVVSSSDLEEALS